MEYFTLKQVAAELNISPQYLWTLLHMGRFEAHKVGSQYLVHKEEVEAFKKRREQKNSNSKITESANV